MSARCVLVTMCVALATTGCIKDSLRRCGDLVCAASSACIAGRCVPNEALAACANRDDASPCTTSQLPEGVCSQQVCVASGCGNGVIDGNELCDDGNQNGGDGCSERCDSLEICGDGVANFGEQCDCGTDPARVTAPCTTINSDSDVAAQCRASCELRTCGDGVVEGIEQCEPNVTITSATCATFGFYGGTLGCASFCQVNTSTCVGRCGDGTVQGLEQCDGTNLGTQSACQQIGFYRGTLACNALCTYSGCAGRCGDGVWDQSDGEGCDGSLVPTCTALGFYGAGTAGCTGACTPTAGTCARCGDGIVQAPEQCDGTNLNGQTCSTLGLSINTPPGLLCNAACRFDTDNCTTCGNGTCEAATDCNDGCPEECVPLPC